MCEHDRTHICSTGVRCFQQAQAWACTCLPEKNWANPNDNASAWINVANEKPACSQKETVCDLHENNPHILTFKTLPWCSRNATYVIAKKRWTQCYVQTMKTAECNTAQSISLSKHTQWSLCPCQFRVVVNGNADEFSIVSSYNLCALQSLLIKTFAKAFNVQNIKRSFIPYLTTKKVNSDVLCLKL